MSDSSRDRYKIELDDIEKRLEAKVLDHLYPRRADGYPRTIDDVVNKWATYVNNVHKGCTSTLYEHHDFIDTREKIDRIIADLPDEMRPKIEVVLSYLDSKFIEATVDSKKGNPEHKLRLRFPKRILNERDLAAPLRNAGHI